MTMQQLFFQFDGRIPRQLFVFGFFFLFCLQVSVSVVLLHMVGLPMDVYMKKVTQQTLGFDLLSNAAFIWPNIALEVKRLHDIGWCGGGYALIYLGLMAVYLLGFLGAFSNTPGDAPIFWNFVVLLGFASFALFLLMVFVPGMKEGNRFGPPSEYA